MEAPFNYPPDDYALAILTHAAMQTTQNIDTFHTRSTGTNSNSIYEVPAASSASSHAPGVITNHRTNIRDQLQHSFGQPVPSSSYPLRTNTAPGYPTVNSTSRSMDIMSYNHSQGHEAGMGGINPYMNTEYRGMGSRISTNNNELEILNAESYDDGNHPMNPITLLGARNMKSGSPRELPFGIQDQPSITLDTKTDSDDVEKEKTSRKKTSKKHKMENSQLADEEDEARKKARGRPRVDTKDETAADVSLNILMPFCLISTALLCLQKFLLACLVDKSKHSQPGSCSRDKCHVNLANILPCRGGGRRSEWLKELTETVKRLLLFPWRRKFKIYVEQMKR